MKKSKKIIYGVGISILLFANINCSFAATGRVNTEAVRIRAEANTESTVLDVAYEGDNVEIVGETGDWYKINFNGNTGYASKEYITNEDAEETEEPSDSTTDENTNNVTGNTTNNTSEENTNVANETSNTENSSEEGNSETETQSLENKKVKLRLDTDLKLLPTFSSNSLTRTEAGNEVTVIYDLENWIKIEVNSNQGWIAKTLVEEVNSTEEPATTPEAEEPEETADSNVNKKGYVNVETANVRAEASTSATLINTLDEFDEVTIVSESGDWYEIEAGDIKGFVSKPLITIGTISSRGLVEERTVTTKALPEETTTENNVGVEENKQIEATNNKGQEVADFAKQFLGLKYVLGGKSPETGFDCSGFTKYVFKNFGYTLGSVAADQTSIGKEISKEELEVGDLILFYDEAKTKIGHVGIYLGADEFIHAANATRGVVIDGLSSNSYYNTRFVTARRIVE